MDVINKCCDSVSDKLFLLQVYSEMEVDKHIIQKLFLVFLQGSILFFEVPMNFSVTMYTLKVMFSNFGMPVCSAKLNQFLLYLSQLLTAICLETLNETTVRIARSPIRNSLF
jgi:hypothetical protein